jgi:hypothetical protein
MFEQTTLRCALGTAAFLNKAHDFSVRQFVNKNPNKIVAFVLGMAALRYPIAFDALCAQTVCLAGNARVHAETENITNRNANNFVPSNHYFLAAAAAGLLLVVHACAELVVQKSLFKGSAQVHVIANILNGQDSSSISGLGYGLSPWHWRPDLMSVTVKGERPTRLPRAENLFYRCASISLNGGSPKRYCQKKPPVELELPQGFQGKDVTLQPSP